MTLQSRYTILRKITDGGTAEIFLAKQLGAHGFEKAVVLKRIFTAFYADPQFRHMLVDEAHIAMTLSHSNIVQVLDLGEVDGRYFLALELVDGWTLDRTLKRAQAAGVPFPPALALYVTAEVCRALAYAHAKASDGKPLGIVHRDVSPHNVLMSAEGEVKLTDFGIAKAHSNKEKSLGNMIKGKISFMSPEQASGAAIDARSDLFSLGTMLYAMITRRLPFDAATDYEALMLVKSGDYLPPETARPGLNPELYRVIRKAMSKSADDRYQKAEEMLVDVEQVMRLAFRAVGQTELQRWLSDLSAKDGVPPLTREVTEPLGGATIVDPPRHAPGTTDSGQDSGLVLDLDDAIEVSSQGRPGGPPPTPAGAPAVTPPLGGSTVIPNLRGGDPDAPWYKRPIGIGALLLAIVLLLLVVGLAIMDARRKSGVAAPAPETAAATPAPPPPAPVAVEPVKAPPVVVMTPDAAASPTATVDAAPAPAEAKHPTKIAAAEPAEAPAPKVDKKASKADTPDDDAPKTASAATKQPKPKLKNEEAPAHEPSPKAHKPAPPTTVAVTFKSSPEGAHVAAHDHAYGTTPQSTKLTPGAAYDLTFTKAGYASVTKHYVAPSSTSAQTLRVTLKKLAEASKKGPPKAATAATPAPASRKGWFSR